MYMVQDSHALYETELIISISIDSHLVNRNVTCQGRRTSMRLEPEHWESLTFIAKREGVQLGTLVNLIDGRRRNRQSLTSAARVFITYWYKARYAETLLKPIGLTTPVARMWKTVRILKSVKEINVQLAKKGQYLVRDGRRV